MRGYLLSIIGIVLLSSVIMAILPEGKTNGIIKNTAKLCCIVVILSPIVNLLKNNKNIDFSSKLVIQTDESFINYCCKEKIRNTEEEIVKYIRTTYSLDTKVILKYDLEDLNNLESLKILEINIEVLKGEYIEKMKEELEKLYGVKVNIESG